MKLSKRINLVVTFLITIIMVFSLFIALPVQRAHLNLINKKLIDLMQIFITRDNSGIANAIFEKRKNAIDQRMEKIREIPDVLFAAVFDSDYSILSSHEDYITPEGLEKKFAEAAKEGKTSWTDSSSLWYLQSISVYDENMGFVLIRYSLNDMVKRDAINSLSIIALYLLLMTAVLLSVSFIIRRIIIRPVTMIIKSMDNISDDKYGEFIDIESNDEIGELASGFNKMSKRISESYYNVFSIRKMLENIIDSMNSVIFSIDDEENITALNTSAENFTGMTRDGAVGRSYRTVFRSLAPYYDRISDALENKMPLMIKREILGSRYLDISLFPLVSEKQAGAVIRLDDVSENEKREEQLRQSQKMETIGTLAGGLAHDFNNVLTGIVGTASLMKLKTEESIYKPEELLNDIDILEKSAERAAGLVKKLLTISRKYQLDIKIINLNDSLKNVLSICENAFDKKISITAEYYPGNPVIRGDGNQIEQMLLNICINASHAMTIMRENRDYGGELRVSIKKDAGKEIPDENRHEDKSLLYYLISVSDNGVGIAPDIIDSIFDPFFTTKSHNVGSGLGLSMVYNMIKKHDGHISVDSEINKGTVFKIYLPEAPENIRMEYEKKETSSVLHEKSGRILIIDDEEIVRTMLTQMLEKAGYEVLCASEGADGLALLEDMSEKVDLVILDMVMPNMSGDEVYSEIRRRFGKIKVLLSSGFSHDSRVQSVIESGADGFISKPYNYRELTAQVNLLITGK